MSIEEHNETNTSRIIVKNLPKWCTEAQIRKAFGVKAQITDIKLMYTRDNVFRRFAFVGYASATDALSTIKYTNGTFMDTARVSVELAVPRTSADLKRPWSKYS
jgi:multiple RNA-binding domain-containing protein 1